MWAVLDLPISEEEVEIRFLSKISCFLNFIHDFKKYILLRPNETVLRAIVTL